MKLTIAASLLLLHSTGCIESDWGDLTYDEDPTEGTVLAYGNPTAWCPAQMSVFPVQGAHNIGYDNSCNDGTCDVSCSGTRANSDYGPDSDHFHHGIDVFAHRGAILQAVAPGRVIYALKDPKTGSNQVKIQDACGWSYYYGHLEGFAVQGGQMVVPGQPIGTMGNSGTGGVHLHFNASPSTYEKDIDPLNLLVAAAPTACSGTPGSQPPPPAPTPGCGRLASGEGLGLNEMRASCDGQYQLVMQGDGNAVLYPASNISAAGATWNSRTFGAVPTLWMQTDGNLVVYHGNRAVWDAHTHGNPGATLSIENGALRVISPSGGTLWSSR